MHRVVRQRIIVAIGIAVVSVLAVACAGGTSGLTSPTFSGPARLAGFAAPLPPLTSPFSQTATAPRTQAQINAAASVHANGEGCPLMLPGN
jgi:hypothetical protein